MNKLLLIIVVLLTVNIASAKKAPKFVGSWMSEKIIVEGKEHPMYMNLIFEDDNDIILNENFVFGIWHYEKKTKIMNITSFQISEFTGDWQIIEQTKEQLILKMGDYEWHLFWYDRGEIAKNNSQLNLDGLWKLSRTAKAGGDSSVDEEVMEEAVMEEDVVEEEGNNKYQEQPPSNYLLFENNIQYTLFKNGTGNSSKEGGEWIYNPKGKSILMIDGKRGSLATIKEATDQVFVFELNGRTHFYTKEKVYPNAKEQFVYATGNYEQSEEDIYFPWDDSGKLFEAAIKLKSLSYTKQVLIAEVNAMNTTTIIAIPKIDYESHELSMNYCSVNGTDTTVLWTEKSQGGENSFYPRAKIEYSRIIGKETITVPAGTFECTLVVGSDEDDAKLKYWMIDNQPGVYAKVLSYKKLGYNTYEYAIFELTNIEKK